MSFSLQSCGRLFCTTLVTLFVFAFDYLMPELSFGMPFNTDMFEVQPGVDAVARKKPEGSVGIGSLHRQTPDLSTDWVQKNPYAEDLASIERGTRRFQINCTPCHGSFKEGKHVVSAFMEKGMPSIDLSSDAVRYSDPGTNQQPKPDAHFFTYVFNGGVIMPRYGFKFSNSEIWDLVSYIRSVQVKAAEKQALK